MPKQAQARHIVQQPGGIALWKINPPGVTSRTIVSQRRHHGSQSAPIDRICSDHPTRPRRPCVGARNDRDSRVGNDFRMEGIDSFNTNKMAEMELLADLSAQWPPIKVLDPAVGANEAQPPAGRKRSAERRVGKGCDSTCISRGRAEN